MLLDAERYRGDTVIILAGYKGKMNQLLAQNDGLRSRFPNNVLFEDYKPDELLEIMIRMANKRSALIAPEAIALLKTKLITEGSLPGNARDIRTMLEKATRKRNSRVVDYLNGDVSNMTNEALELLKTQLCTVTAEDFEF